MRKPNRSAIVHRVRVASHLGCCAIGGSHGAGQRGLGPIILRSGDRVRGIRRKGASETVPRFARFGRGSTIEPPILHVHNPSAIAIGSNVDIRAQVFLEAISPLDHVVLEIDDDTYIGYFVRITALGFVRIGRSVLIADRVYISDTGHDYEDVTVPVKDQGLRLDRKVEIGDGSWIGIGAAIVGNVRIGRGCVVGANAVVNRDVPDFTVVAGSPAHPIRRFDGNGWVRC